MTTKVDDLVSSLRTHGMPSVRNILVTVFGDALRPYGSSVSVQSLTRLLEPLDVTERLVRTSLTRLADDNLVQARRLGSRSYYGVHESAEPLFDQAEERIYHRPERKWDRFWTVAIVDGAVGTSAQRSEVRRQLAVIGLGPVTPNVMASPVVEPAEVAALVRAVGSSVGVLVTRSENVSDVGHMSDVELARRVMSLDDLAEHYREIIAWFAPLDDDGDGDLSPAESFIARTLLIATYRRIVLADPLLSASLLPNPWRGNEAFELAARVYAKLESDSERWLVEVCETPTGPLAKPRLRRIFGAL
jgi:phenylacetic acid degradation operon negative regulatory protein